MIPLNIVIPVYNEDESVLPFLQTLANQLNVADRLIVVDASDSFRQDFYADFLSNNKLYTTARLFVISSNKGRAVQMNAGAGFLLSQTERFDQNSLLWFLHVDSGFSCAHLQYLRELDRAVQWGRFDVRLIPNVFPFAIISKLINLRSRMTQVMTGDQGIFMRADIFRQLRGYANIQLMEDVEITKRLKKLSKADCDGPVLYTSARRWQKHGWAKTVLLMWQLRLLYWLGVSPSLLVKKYYG